MSDATNTNNASVSFLDRAKAALTSPLAKALGISVISAGAGAAGGYYFAKHKGAQGGVACTATPDAMSTSAAAAAAPKAK